MNEHETERELRAWFAAQPPLAAPPELRRSVAAIPATTPLPLVARLVATLTWRPVFVPRAAWAVILVALAIALVGTTAYVGSRLLDARPVLPPAVVSTPAPTPSVTPAGTPIGAYGACASAATTPITLTTLDQEAGDAISSAIDQLNREFQVANPGVTIAREQRSADDLRASVQAALADPNGPDIVQVEQGREGMGAAVRAGLLLQLTDYATQYGWDDRWARGILARTSFSDDGRTFGSGTLYGVSVTGEIVGLFRNNHFAAQDPGRGSLSPQSLAEQMELFSATKEAGDVPVVFGAADGDAIEIYASILEAMVEFEWLDDLVYGRNNVSFATPETVAAAKLLVEMSDRGYFTEGYESIGHDDAVALFASNKGEYLWADSRVGPILDAVDGVTFYFRAVPPLQAGDLSRSVGGVGLPWAIRKTSPDPDCAGAYLDFITSNHAMLLLANQGVLPSRYVGGAPEPMRALNYTDVLFAFSDASTSGRLGHRLDAAFPTARATFTANLAKLMAKEISPEEFVRVIDGAYQAYLTTLR
jgi:raffinose/stachyose/melibiose transport system substrate-binding protein